MPTPAQNAEQLLQKMAQLRRAQEIQAQQKILAQMKQKYYYNEPKAKVHKP